jgi:hypothetical protein
MPKVVDEFSTEKTSLPGGPPGSFTVNEDTQIGTVILNSGFTLKFKEPTGLSILKAKGWITNADPEYRTNEFLILKLIHSLLIEFNSKDEIWIKSNLTLDDFINSLAIEHFLSDLNMLGECLKFFRNWDILSKQLE